MRVKTRKQIVAKGKAALAMRRAVGWTRAEWINGVESALGEAFIAFCKARLADKNGQRRPGRSWTVEFECELFRRMIDVHVHPVKRAFDRRAAFQEAIAEMHGALDRLRDHVEREFSNAVGRVRRGIDDRDVKEFWTQAREATRVLTGAD
jgi:hypothetical protein